MTPRRIGAILGALTACAAAVWLLVGAPQRTYAKDLEAGMRAYLAGDLARAETMLSRAVRRRPAEGNARQLYVKVVVEDALRRLRSGERAEAIRRVQSALACVPGDSPERSELKDFERRIAAQAGGPRDISSRLAALSREPADSAVSTEELLSLVLENQRLWQSTLDQESRRWRFTLAVGAAFAATLAGLLAFLAWVLHRAFGHRGWMAQRLAEHSRQLLSSGGFAPYRLPEGPGSELRKIDFIEAELVNSEDSELARSSLKSYLETEDPWVRARAAKAFHRLDPSAALSVIQALLDDGSRHCRLSGIWALGELALPESVSLLSRLAWNDDPEVQKAVLRALVQIERQKSLPPDAERELKELLTRLRQSTDWII